MAKRRQSLAEKAGEFELNLTPMIDAVFLLLIFFMTTTVFVKATQLKIELPDSVHYDQLKAEKKLNLRVASDGRLEINGQLVAMAQLAGWLEREKVRSGSSTLIITADADAAHGHIIDAMETATMAGIEKIDIETEEPTNGR